MADSLFSGLQIPTTPDAAPAAGGQPARITVRPEPAAKPDSLFAKVEVPSKVTTTGEALGRGVARGVTFNFLDEIEGLAAAGGLAPDDPDVVHAVTALAKGGYKKIMGDPEAEAAFADQVKKSRLLTAQQDAEHPIAATAGQVAGAVMIPAGAALRGATMAGRMGSAAAVGAGFGGLSAAGEAEGDLGERAPKAATGAGIGAAAGAIAVPAMAAIETGLRKLAEPLGNIWRGLTAPEAEAGRRVVSTIRRDQANGNQGFDAAGFARAQAEGQPVINADIGGEATRALARTAANNSPEARAVLERSINDRFEAQGGRLSSWLNTRFNFPNADRQSQAIEHVARTVNTPNYRRAFSDPNGHGLWDEGFEQLTVAPVVKEAIRDAAITGANKAARDGARPPQPPFVTQADGSLRLRDPNQLPNLEFWDAVKKNLDNTISKAQRTGDKNAVNDARDLKNALLDRLDDAVPSYRQARSTAAGFFGADHALEAGQNFFGMAGRLGIGEARREHARMSPVERQLFADGYADRMIQKARNADERRNILIALNRRSEGARDEMTLALGGQRATELEAFMRSEAIMDRLRGALGNSTSVRQWIETLGAGSAAGSIAGALQSDIDPRNPVTAMTAILSGAAAFGRGRLVHRVDQNVARHVAELLVSDNPGQLSQGLQIIASRPDLMNALRAGETSLAGVAGRPAAGQAASIPSTSAVSGARAEDDKKKR